MTFAWWHILVIIVPILPTFWSIIHIWRHSFQPPERKLAWLAFVVFLPVLGGLIYIFTGRRQALPESGQRT